jgi:hypothetical protein
VREGCASEFGDNLRINAETVFRDLNGLHHGSDQANSFVFISPSSTDFQVPSMFFSATNIVKMPQRYALA